MIFTTLWESSKRGELLLVEDGFCHWHLRRDGQLTIREIISLRPGVGQKMLEILKGKPGVKRIVAKCPADLIANAWYARRGFVLERNETTTRGRLLNVWSLNIPESNHDP